MKDYSVNPTVRTPRSRFNMSHGWKSTFNASELVPFYCQEVLPGDTHSVTANVFARLATPLFPIMDNLHGSCFFFFVPNRLSWENWERFMGAQDDPGDSTDYVIPAINPPAGGWEVGSLGDYFGLPIGVDTGRVSALPFRAYGRIWNDWFRSQDLQDSSFSPINDGPDNPAFYVVRNRGKRHDYMTSALPWPQKGPGVDLPLGTYAQIYGVGIDNVTPLEVYGFADDGIDLETTHVFQDTVGASPVTYAAGGDGAGNLFADLSNASAATINDLRQAFQIQKLQERDARGGTRYQELVLSHFGVLGGDARLQRSEYLGGGKFRVGITQVPQTSETVETPQGNLAAYGTMNGRGGFTKSFTEHGYIIGLLNVYADLTYQRGLQRHWSRETKYDFYWPSLAHIGEQAVLQREIYVDGTEADDDVFGYQERFAEYRGNMSQITGLFRSNAPGSLDAWHLSQDFESRPVLNDSFIQENVPMDRIKAVVDEPDFLVDVYFQATAVRPMPVNGTPGLIDHF